MRRYDGTDPGPTIFPLWARRSALRGLLEKFDNCRCLSLNTLDVCAQSIATPLNQGVEVVGASLPG